MIGYGKVGFHIGFLTIMVRPLDSYFFKIGNSKGFYVLIFFAATKNIVCDCVIMFVILEKQKGNSLDSAQKITLLLQKRHFAILYLQNSYLLLR